MPVIRESRKCKNTHCAVGEFIPEHGNQQYCDQECYRFWNNNKQKVLNETVFRQEKQLRKNQKVLRELYAYEPFRLGVELDYLIHKGMDVKVFSEELIHTCTDMRVFWSHDYGIGVVRNTDAKKFIIFKR